MGGPSQASKDNSAAQAAFYKQMTEEQAKAFSEDQNLFEAIKAVSIPILNAGIYQFGYSAPEWSDIQGYIKSTGATATANAVNAEELKLRQEGGGAQVLPTGAAAQLDENVRLVGNQQTATSLQQARLSGYSAGRQNYQMALGALTGEQQLLNPAQYASATANAGTAATGATQLMDSERSNLVSSILGGLAQGAIGVATGGASTILDNALGAHTS